MKDIQETIFGVPIWGFIMQEQKYQSRDYVDCIFEIKDSNPSVKKSNFGGYQTHDNLHKIPVFREFVTSLEKIGANIFSEYTDNKIQNMQITELWGNINNHGDFNGAHVHGGVLSGVFYIKTPINCGKLIFKNPAVRSDAHLIRMKDYPIIPEPLACIIFPSWLEHYVEPNMSDEERISLSFNLNVR
jgi:uncharacterized protein (TIGR02466 family)